MKRYWMAMTMAMMCMIAAGCGKEQAQPVPIDEGVDTCEVCNMSVADNAFAVQLALDNGRVYKYDDLGCMYDWKAQNKEAVIQAEFVRDAKTAEWINRQDAFYVFDPTLQTPMSYGVYSFKSKADAEAFIQKEGVGKLLTAQELEQHEWRRHFDDVQELKKQLQHEHQHSHGN